MTTYQQDFYKQIGFQENQTTTMVIYNNDFPQHQISSNKSEEVANEIMQQY
jgi:hypothetical protein